MSENWVELTNDTNCQRSMPLHRGKMADEFVVASEKYGSGDLERKYRFSAENGKVERIGGRGGTIAASFKKFFKVVTWFVFLRSCI